MKVPIRFDRRWRLFGCIIAFLALVVVVNVFKVHKVIKRFKDDPDRPIFFEQCKMETMILPIWSQGPELNRKDFKKYIYKQGISKNQSIPKIIHQIWSDDILPDQFVDHVKSVIKYNRHPEWSYYFWTLDVGREFIRQNYPKLLSMYESKDKITRADILRFVVIYHYGGVYMDLDIVCVRPLDRFVENHQCALVLPHPEYSVAYEKEIDYRGVNNALYLCRAGHPFFKLLIERSEQFAEMCNGNQACPRPEFPHPLLVYLTDSGKNDIVPELVDRYLFDGIYDPAIENLLEQKCSKRNYDNLELAKQKICEDWKASGKGNRTIPEEAYTFHTWYHANARRVTSDVKNKIPNIVPHVESYNVLLHRVHGTLNSDTKS